MSRLFSYKYYNQYTTIMGWTSFSMHEPVKDWFTREYDDEKREVLDVALVKRNTMFAAVKIRATGEVIAFVFLIRWSRDYYNFSYKDMTEFSGPGEIECPKRIMKLLTPLNDESDPNGYARKWRQDVQEFWDNKALMSSPSHCIKTESPVEFTSGMRYQYFKKIGKRMYAGRLDKGMFKIISRVRLTLKYWNFEMVECRGVIEPNYIY